MIFELKLKLEQFRQRQNMFFDEHGKNKTPLPATDAELMLQIIRLFEEEIFNIEMWRDR